MNDARTIEEFGVASSASASLPGDLYSRYDASRPESLFQDGGRTQPVTDSGQTVRGVADVSGSGRHLAGSHASTIYLAGKQAIRYPFDLYPAAQGFAYATGEFTVACVMSPYLGTSQFLGQYKQTNPFTMQFSSYSMRAILPSGSFGSLGCQQDRKCLFMLQGAAGGLYTEWFNGKKGLTTPAPGSFNPTFKLGLSRSHGGAVYPNVDFRELMAYERELSAAEMASVAAYLVDKWEIPV